MFMFSPVTFMTSVIPSRSIDELQLEPGSDVVALVKSTEVSIAKLLARVPPTTQASMEYSRRPDRPVARQRAMKATRISSTVANAASGSLAAALHNPARMPLTSNPARPAFYRLRDIVRISALSRSTIYRRIADGRFPPPVHLGGRASGWPSEALQRWIDDPLGYRVAPPRPAPDAA
jgi:prophage regulatory protein